MATSSKLCMFVLRRWWCQTVLDSVYKINWDHNEDMWKEKGRGREEWEMMYFCSWKLLCTSLAPFLTMFQDTAQALVMAHARFGRGVRQFLSPFRGWVSGIWITRRERQVLSGTGLWQLVLGVVNLGWGSEIIAAETWAGLSESLHWFCHQEKSMSIKIWLTFINFSFDLIFSRAGKASNPVRIGISSVKSCLLKPPGTLLLTIKARLFPKSRY